MRLSDAIALGRTLCVSTPYVQDDSNGGGCALGMAARAMGKKSTYRGVQIQALDIDNYPATMTLVKQPCNCEKCSMWTSILGNAIVSIFNYHVHGDQTWTLDQLIDWVRSAEPAEPAEPAESQEAITEEYKSELAEICL